MDELAQSALDRAWEMVAALSGDIGPRVAGTDAERAAADLIVEAYAARGLAAVKQPFRWVGWEPVAAPSVRIEEPDGSIVRLRTASMAFTDSTPPGGITGNLVPAGVCELVPGLLEWPRYAVEIDGMARAYVAVVPHGPVRPFPRPERQLLLDAIAIVGADEFAPYADRLARGERLTATVATQGRYVVGNSSVNVIAELPGASPETIVISAHYDTVAGTPGAGDNASGVAGCLALAEHFANRPLAKTLRFINWGAHEFGLLGSQAYVQDLAQWGRLVEIRAALALDILCDGDRLGIWLGGERFAAEFTSRRDTLPDHFPIEFHCTGRGETDSWSFAERGIDTAMFLTLPYAHFHLATDSIANNDRQLFAFSVSVARHMIEQLLAS